MTFTDRDQTYVLHMLECIERIREYSGMQHEKLLNDRLTQDAILRVMQTMAESSQRLSDTAKASQPEINWRGIAGFRNILVHDYLGGIDIELIWQVIETELSPLETALLKLKI